MRLLTVEDLRAGYGPLEILQGIDLVVDKGEIVVILGANGAGKTTTMRALSGMISRRGSVTFLDKNISETSAESIVKLGMAHVPQGRGTFSDLSVEDNLRAGAYIRSDASGIDDDILT